MFTIDDIKHAHAKVKSGADFPQYIRALKSLGVVMYDTFVGDGRTHYYGIENFSIIGPPRYTALTIQIPGDNKQLKKFLAIHQAGKTDFPTFCRQAAEAGVEKWTVHLVAMACTYFDAVGNVMIIEDIPE